MTIDYTIWNLKEAAEELSRLIRQLEDETDDGDFATGVGLAHIYSHLNTAWNARAASIESVAEASETDFHRWRRFPDDLPDNFKATRD